MAEINNTFCVKHLKGTWKKGNISDLNNFLKLSEIPFSKSEKEKIPCFGFAKPIGKKSNTPSYPTSFIVLEIDTPKDKKAKIKQGDKVLEHNTIEWFKALFSKLVDANGLNAYAIYLTPSMRGLRFILQLDKPVYNEREYKKVVIKYLEGLRKFGVNESFWDILVNQLWFFPTFQNFFKIFSGNFFQNFFEKKAENIQETAKKTGKTHFLEKKEIEMKENNSEKKVLEKIISFLNKKGKSITRNYSDWIKVGFALVNTFSSYEAENYFLSISRFDSEKFDEAKCKEKFHSLLNGKPSGHKASFGSIIFLAQQQGFRATTKEFEKLKQKYRGIQFWDISEKGKLTILQRNFCSFLNEQGFHYFDGFVGRKPYIYVHRNVIKQIETHEIKRYVDEYIEKFSDDFSKQVTKEDLQDKMVSGANVYFGEGKLEYLKPINYKQHRDTKKESFIPFENGVAKITKDGLELISYNQINGQYWDNQIKNKRINFKAAKERSDFEKFVYKVSGKNKDKFLRLKCLIGYLLHTYKDPTNAKAVIFLDKYEPSNKANGGVGKSLLAKGIGHVRRMHSEDGKNFDNKHKFKFQQIRIDTQLLLIEDISPQFDFEKLYPAITDSMTIERKNQTAYNLLPKESPKFLITSNYLVQNDGGNSFKRRVECFEFERTYSGDFTPFDDFKRRLFDDWKTEDWNDFYCFMLNCIVDYLKHGIPKSKNTEMVLNHAHVETSNSFGEISAFAEKHIESDMILENLNKYVKNELYSDFLADNPHYSKDSFSQNALTKGLKAWGEGKNYEVFDKKSNSKSYLCFKK